MLIMESDIRKELLLFNGQSDLTFSEMKIWRSAMYCMVTANQNYCEKMREAADLLFTFSELCRKNATKGKNSQNAALRISQLLTKIHDFHKEMFGDFNKFTDRKGPFGDLVRSSDCGFRLLQKRSTDQLKEHVHCEKRVAKAWKYYVRRLKKMEKIVTKFSKTLNQEQMNKEYRFIAAKQKLKHAVSLYNTCWEDEIKHREVLAKQTMAIQEEFLKDEKTKLNVMFTFINDALGRLDRLVPVGLDGNGELNFEPEVARTKALAKVGWELYLKKHIFPERQQVCGQQAPKQIADVCDEDGDEDEDEDEDEDGDDYSDDEGSENEDARDEIGDAWINERTGPTQQKVESLAAPKVNNTGMIDVLQEILDSLDDDIKERSQTGRKSPESVKERSRDSSDESEKPKSPSSVIRRQRSRASSPVPRKRKSLKESPRSRKCRSPDSSQEVGEEEACGSHHESGKYRGHNSSSNQRGKTSCKPSSQIVIEDVRDEEISSPSPRDISSKSESLERRKDDEVNSGKRSQSHSEARRRRRQSSDRRKSTIVQDSQDVVEVAPDFRLKVKLEEASYHSQVSRVRDSSPSQRGQRSRQPKSQDVFKDVTDEETSSPLPESTRTKRESLESRKYDEVSSGRRSQSNREAHSRQRQSSDGNKTTIVQDFQDVAELPPTRAKNQWVGPSPDIDVPQRNKKTEDKEVTAAETKSKSRSESHKRKRAAKKSKNHNEDLSFEDKVRTSKDSPKPSKKVSTVQNSPRVEVASGVQQTDVYVYVLQDREKQNPGEISIRAGMKLKQLRFPDTEGMAYGYKKNKLGFKKYGCYPASFVTLKSPGQGEL